MKKFEARPELHGVILPVCDEVPRPRWSVVIPTYNCAKYLEETLGSVLQQAPGRDEMEIIVVDDHSTKDDPQAVVDRLGRERVRFIQQKQNVGKARNYESGINASRGHLIHQLHGDDRIKPGFYDSMARAFEAHPDAGAFFCESEYINGNGEVTGRTGKERDDTGLIDNWLEKIVQHQRVQTPSIVVRRAAYERMGGFDRRLSGCEDWEMWIRLATEYQVGFVAECLAQYRIHRDNTSSLSVISGTNIQTHRNVLSIVDSYLPDSLLARSRSLRNTAMAHELTRHLPGLISRVGICSWAKFCLEVLRYRCSPRVVYYLLYFSMQKEINSSSSNLVIVNSGSNRLSEK